MKLAAILSTLFLLICSSQPARANSIRELLAMNFGIFTITDSGAHSITVEPNGNTIPDGGVHKLRNGRAGRFQIMGISSADLFYITIDPTTLTHTSGSPVFTIDSFTFDPPNDAGNMIHTDPDNNLVIEVGATLHIAPGTTATRGAYRGTYNFMINF